MKTKTVQVAIYTNKYGSEQVNEVKKWIEECEDYVRITEPTEVSFIPLDYDTVLQLRLTALDREIESVRANASRKIDDLKEQKQRLLAITYQDPELSKQQHEQDHQDQDDDVHDG